MKKATINIFFTILIIGVLQTVSVFAGATLTVNWIGAGEACDNQLTLAEATHLGRGSFPRALTTAERNQISGATFAAAPLPPECAGSGWVVTSGLGSNDADDIVFVSGITSSIGYGITLGANDDINGATGSSKVILDGSGTAANTSGVNFVAFSGSQVRNLVIRNFPANGIDGYAPNGAIFEGLEIYGNGGNGIQLGYFFQTNVRNVTIGGSQPQHRNLIYGNGANGILIFASENEDRSPDQNIVIKNNYIGTSDGTTDNGNNGDGIYMLQTFGVTIGDTTGATRNVISGNSNDGIGIFGAKAVSNTIVGNFIGVASDGSTALGNNSSGIALLQGAGDAVDFATSSANRIGLPNLGNVIGANSFGVFLADANTSNNWIQANYIGTNTGGTADVGNSSDGVYFVNGTYDNRVGGTGTGEGNLIAFNRNGIRADNDVRNRFQRNRIFSNDSLGIDLTPAVGVTQNDTGDADTGANNLQNFPVITNVNAQSSSVNIQGTFNSQANQTYALEFFGNTAVDGSGYGEGRNFIGTTNVTTDSSGNATFNQTFSVSLATVGTWVTATATDGGGNTSEFSQARNICATLTLSPQGLLASAAGGASSFTVINSAGCSYTAASNDSWITLGSTSMGTINFIVAPNPGVQRSGSIRINFNNGSFLTFVNFNISQSNGCAFSINPTSQNVSGAGGSGSFNLAASDASCTWAIGTTVNWITINSSLNGSGSAVIAFTVPTNGGAARTGAISVGGQTFTINQAAACAYSLSSSSTSVGASGTTGNFQVICGSGCGWTATSNASWITITGGSGTGNGTGFVFYSVAANTGAARSGTITTTGGLTFTVNQAAAARRAKFDFDGDGKSDVSVFRPSNGTWYLQMSQNGFAGFAFGAAGDKIAPADFDGDGKTDIAVVRNGTWYIQRSSLGFTGIAFGDGNDIPMPADFDGDGKDDLAVFRPSNGVWYIQRSSLGFVGISFGTMGDVPVAADYDGDGKADVAVFRPSNGTWYLQQSQLGFVGIAFGAGSDKPAPGDYDGDGKADLAVFRPSNGVWYLQQSQTGFNGINFGASGDLPAPADFDGDGKTDLAVFRPSNGVWYLQRSAQGFTGVVFGTAGDKPAPNAFVP